MTLCQVITCIYVPASNVPCRHGVERALTVQRDFDSLGDMPALLISCFAKALGGAVQTVCPEFTGAVYCVNFSFAPDGLAGNLAALPARGKGQS